MVFSRYKLLTTVLLLSLAAGIYVLALRHGVESRNKAVDIAIDYAEVDALSAATGKSIAQVLSKLKQAGVTSVAVQEMTINDLVQNGDAVVFRSGKSDMSKIYISTSELAHQVHEYLDAAIPEAVRKSTGSATGASDFSQVVEVRASVPYIKALPIGLPPQSSVVQKQGLNLIARLFNFPGINPETVDHSLGKLKEAGIETIIFGGDQVLGFRNLIPEVAEGFNENGLCYGSIEFSKQKGDANLSAKLASRLVRVHSIPSAELPSLDMPSAVERYVRAAKERNIRLLYVRMFDMASADPMASNVEYITRIARSLEKEGFTVRQAHPMGEVKAPGILTLILAAGVAAGAVLLIGSVIELGAAAQAVFFGLLFIFLAGLGAGGGDMGRKVVALAAAVTFPTLAVIFSGQAKPRASLSWAWGAVLGRFLAVTAITASGGVLVASLLASRDFMLKLDQFAGVKFAQLLPILLLTAVYTAQIAWNRGTWQEQKKKAVESVRNLFAQPVLVWQTAAVFAALVLVAIVLARSGNEPGVGVSPLELKFRALLDQVLIVRPRTKEFLFGHPVIMAAIALVLAGRRRWAAPLLVLGAIGQVSVLNTFCHIHTPIVTSALRVLIGAATGAVAGFVLLAVMRVILKTKGTESK